MLFAVLAPRRSLPAIGKEILQISMPGKAYIIIIESQKACEECYSCRTISTLPTSRAKEPFYKLLDLKRLISLATIRSSWKHSQYLGPLGLGIATKDTKQHTRSRK